MYHDLTLRDGSHAIKHLNLLMIKLDVYLNYKFLSYRVFLNYLTYISKIYNGFLNPLYILFI